MPKPPKDSDKPKLTVIHSDRSSITQETAALAHMDDHSYMSPIDPKDITSLNIEALREAMLRGVYVLESSLFTQSSFEYQRLMNNRKILSKLEGDIFSEEQMQNLNPEQKIRLYSIVQNNMNSSLNFFQNLHNNVNSGIEALSKIDKLKSERPKASEDNPKEKESLNDIRNKILARIKEKTAKEK